MNLCLTWRITITNYLYKGKQIKTGEWKYGTLDIFLDDNNDLLYHIRQLDKITNAFQASTVDSKTVSKCIDYTGDFKTSIFEGDIIQYTCNYDGLDGFSKTYTCQAIAVYNEEEKQFGFVLNKEGVPEFFNWEDIITTNDFSIVGNIWDNSELVKVRLNEYFKND